MKWATAFVTDCRPLHGLVRYSLSYLGFRSQTRSPQALCFRPLRGLRTFDCDVCPRGRARSGGRACVCLEGGLLIDDGGRGLPRSDGRASVFSVVRLLIDVNFASASLACRV
jgi:hypothetical protein